MGGQARGALPPGVRYIPGGYARPFPCRCAMVRKKASFWAYRGISGQRRARVVTSLNLKMTALFPRQAFLQNTDKPRGSSAGYTITCGREVLRYSATLRRASPGQDSPRPIGNTEIRWAPTRGVIHSRYWQYMQWHGPGVCHTPWSAKAHLPLHPGGYPPFMKNFSWRYT